MKEIVEYRTENGNPILIEVDRIDGESGIELAASSRPTFEESLDKIMPAASTIIEKFQNLSKRPDQVEVEFGVKMTATGGAILALFTSIGGEINYKVTLRWGK